MIAYLRAVEALGLLSLNPGDVEVYMSKYRIRCQPYRASTCISLWGTSLFELLLPVEFKFRGLGYFTISSYLYWPSGLADSTIFPSASRRREVPPGVGHVRILEVYSSYNGPKNPQQLTKFISLAQILVQILQDLCPRY